MDVDSVYYPVVFILRPCQSQPSPWTNSAQRRRITSTYFGSNSIVQLTRFVCSQAISVLPDPPNRSSTVSPAFEELKIALIASAVGFCVGCTYSRVLSRLMSQEEYGRLPLLLRRAEAVVTLNASSGRLYACSNGGKRLYEVPLKRLPDGKVSFLADNASGKEPVLVYEFLRTK